MQPVSITVSNELAALPVLQAAVAAFAQAAGAELAVARGMELVTEEIVTNIIKFEYLPDQREAIEVTLGSGGKTIELAIRFRGIPFDIDYLKRCEEVSLGEIVSAEVHGIGLHLVRQLCDELQYRNLGKEGQLIRIVRSFVPARQIASVATVTAGDAVDACPVPPAEIRRMRPDESAHVSRLAYFAYSYSYVYEHIYDPDLVRALNRDGRMLSFVAVAQETGEIMGHCALLPDEDSGLEELGVAFVNPRYRGGGCLNDLSERLLEEARNHGASGVFVMAVSTHPYSQKAATRIGLRESGLLLSRVQPLAMRAIHNRETAREALFFMVLPFDAAGADYFPPPRHRKMLERICAHVGLEVTMAECAAAAPLAGSGSLEQSTDHYQAGHIRLRSYGDDSLAKVRDILHGWCLDRLETVYLYLPLRDPATATATGGFEGLGFFFSGLQPGRLGNDMLVLQYLNNQRQDYDALRAATPFGEELVAYVRTCDPNGGSRQGGQHADRCY